MPARALSPKPQYNLYRMLVPIDPPMEHRYPTAGKGILLARIGCPVGGLAGTLWHPSPHTGTRGRCVLSAVLRRRPAAIADCRAIHPDLGFHPKPLPHSDPRPFSRLADPGQGQERTEQWHVKKVTDSCTTHPRGAAGETPCPRPGGNRPGYPRHTATVAGESARRREAKRDRVASHGAGALATRTTGCRSGLSVPRGCLCACPGRWLPERRVLACRGIRIVDLCCLGAAAEPHRNRRMAAQQALNRVATTCA